MDASASTDLLLSHRLTSGCSLPAELHAPFMRPTSPTRKELSYGYVSEAYQTAVTPAGLPPRHAQDR